MEITKENRNVEFNIWLVCEKHLGKIKIINKEELK